MRSLKSKIMAAAFALILTPAIPTAAIAGNYTQDIQELYIAYFSRPADPAGLAYWESIIEATVAAGGNADSVINSISSTFGKSPEYLANFANLTDSQKVTKIYQNLFSHDPDPGGLLYWTLKLQTGALTIDQIVRAISESAVNAGNTDGVAYNAKVAAATAFTDALDSTGEIIGYTGAQAGDRAKAWLAGITDQKTLDAGIATAALNSTVTYVITSTQTNNQTATQTADAVKNAVQSTVDNAVQNAVTTTATVIVDVPDLGGGDLLPPP